MILVTGASSDIGISTIKNLLKDNKKIWAIYKKNDEKLEELRNKNKSNLILSRYDFSKENDLDKFMNEIDVKSNLIDSFISLAAIRKNIEYGKITKKDLHSHFQVNVIPVILIIQYLGKSMEKNEFGRIVIGSSIGIKFGGSNETFPYALTKLASELIPNIAKNWASKNVLYNIVRIGFTKTSSTKNNPNYDYRQNLIPMKRAASPDEVANFITWLSSSKNTYMTNQVISFSGGE